MTGSNLTIDGEIRYIIQWFHEWSELQREDFIPIFVEYLKVNEGYVNGLVVGMNNANCDDKPLSLFQCRVKLFREWSRKWPEATKDRLKEKLKELDSDIMDKIEAELKVMENGNGHDTSNGDVGDEEGNKEEVVDVDVVPQLEAVEVVAEPQSLVTNNLPDEIATA